MGRAVILPGLLSGLGLAGWGQSFPKWPHLEDHRLIPERFASNVLPPQQATVTPVFPGDPLRTAIRSDSDSCGVCFALGPSTHEITLCTFQEQSLCFPQSPGAPVYRPHRPSMPNAPWAPSPNANSPSMGTRRGAQNSHSHRSVSLINLLSSLWASHLADMGLLIIE